MEVEARELDGVSIVVASSIDRCSSYFKHKDELGAVNTSESTFWNKRPDTEGCRRTNPLATFDFEEGVKFGSLNESTLSMPSLEGKQIQRKTGKPARSNSGFSKRSRMPRIEGVSINEVEADNVKEKNQPAKQKNALNGKRGDKRNGKVPTKGRYDYFSRKAGMVSFNSAAGGNNFLGNYGLKPDTCDVTAHLDELSVNELLDGSYKGPIFSKDKAKKAANLNENILLTVRKACSVLWPHKPLKTQNSAENDNSCNHKVPTCPVSSDASVADLSSHDKVQDSFNKPKAPDNVLDFPLCQPKDVLERLALPPPKDLDSLLLDVAKPSVLSKSNSDSRGKQGSQRATLSPFSWSYGGYNKLNPDTIKLSSSKSTCQGKWLKIGNTPTSVEGKSGFLEVFDSLTFDHSLVPLANEIGPSTPVSFPWLELGSSSSAKRSTASQLPPAGLSPRLFAAAQTLCDIAATHSLKQELHGMERWPKKPSEKTMKACKSKSNGKS